MSDEFSKSVEASFDAWLAEDSTHWIGDQDAAWQAWMYVNEQSVEPLNTKIAQLKAENESLKGSCKAMGEDMAKVTRERNSARAQASKLKAENEALRATVDLQKLLPELDEALEDLELHGRHSDQGYRKLKDWYRKIALAYRVIKGPMFGAEHGELVSQNTWLRSVVEHYAQQHAPVEPIPDMDGWSARLPGYDLPALLKDAERWRCVRNAIPMQSPYAVWREGSHVVLGKDADDLVDNFLLAKEANHD